MCTNNTTHVKQLIQKGCLCLGWNKYMPFVSIDFPIDSNLETAFIGLIKLISDTPRDQWPNTRFLVIASHIVHMPLRRGRNKGVGPLFSQFESLTMQAYGLI